MSAVRRILWWISLILGISALSIIPMKIIGGVEIEYAFPGAQFVVVGVGLLMVGGSLFAILRDRRARRRRREASKSG